MMDVDTPIQLDLEIMSYNTCFHFHQQFQISHLCKVHTIYQQGPENRSIETEILRNAYFDEIFELIEHLQRIFWNVRNLIRNLVRFRCL